MGFVRVVGGTLGRCRCGDVDDGVRDRKGVISFEREAHVENDCCMSFMSSEIRSWMSPAPKDGAKTLKET